MFLALLVWQNIRRKFLEVPELRVETVVVVVAVVVRPRTGAFLVLRYDHYVVNTFQ